MAKCLWRSQPHGNLEFEFPTCRRELEPGNPAWQTNALATEPPPTEQKNNSWRQRNWPDDELLVEAWRSTTTFRNRAFSASILGDIQRKHMKTSTKQHQNPHSAMREYMRTTLDNRRLNMIIKRGNTKKRIWILHPIFIWNACKISIGNK